MNPLYLLLGGIFATEIFAIHRLFISLETSVTTRKNLRNSRVELYHKKAHPEKYWINIGIQAAFVLLLMVAMVAIGLMLEEGS